MAAIAFTPDPGLAFWPTPAELADELVYDVLAPYTMPWGEGIRVLEPSAGVGHLAAAARAHLPLAHITCLEPNEARVAELRLRTAASLHGLEGEFPVASEVVQSTLEDYLTVVDFAVLAGTFEPFDFAFMNPPFALDGRPEAWAEHFLAIYRHPYLLAPGAIISAVVPRIVMTGKSKLVREVRATLGDLTATYRPPVECHAFEHGQIRACDRGAFGPVGAGVSAAKVWVEKPYV